MTESTHVVIRGQTTHVIASKTIPAVGPGGGGVTDHDDLTGRSAADQHPISAVTDLQDALDANETAITDHLGDTSDAHDASAISFSPTGTVAATNVQAAIAEVASESAAAAAPIDATYLTTTSHSGLSAEVVVGAMPGGELSGTWASPTVDASHSGSTHAAVQAAAEATAASALSTHAADTTSVHGITDTSALETTTGSAAKVAAHEADTTNVHGIADTSALETTSGAQAKADAKVSDTAYDATSWNGVTTVAPSKNAVRDQIEAIVAGSGSVSDTAYDATSWNGVTTTAPSKNAVRDEFEVVIASVTSEASARAAADDDLQDQIDLLDGGGTPAIVVRPTGAGHWDRKNLPNPSNDNAGVITVGVADTVATYGMLAWADLQPDGAGTLDPAVIESQLAELENLPNCEGIWLRVNTSGWAPDWVKAFGSITPDSSDILNHPSANVTDATWAIWWETATGSINTCQDAYRDLVRLLWERYGDDPRVLGITSALGGGTYDEPFQRNFHVDTLAAMRAATPQYTAALNRAAYQYAWDTHALYPWPTDCAFNSYQDHVSGTTWDFIDTEDVNVGALMDDFVATLGHYARPSNHSMDVDAAVNTGVTTGTAAAGTSTIAMTGETFSNDQYNQVAGTYDSGQDYYVVIDTTPVQCYFITDTEATVDRLTLHAPLDYAVPAGTTWSIYGSPHDSQGRRYREIYDRMASYGVPFQIQTSAEGGIVSSHTVLTHIELMGAYACELNSNYQSNPYEEHILTRTGFGLRANNMLRPHNAVTQRIIVAGTANADASNTITDADLAGLYADDELVGYYIKIVGGSGRGAGGRISSNTGSTGVIQVETGWATNGTGIDTPCDYEIVDLAFGRHPSYLQVAPNVYEGWGEPEFAAVPGSTYQQLGPTSATWVKASGTDDTGWSLQLAAVNNFADVDDANTALSNLGLGGIGVLGQLTAGFTAPAGSLDRWKAGPGRLGVFLSGSHTTSATTITIGDKAILPDAVNRPLMIDDEIIWPTAGAFTTSLTARRGENGTTATSHADRAEVLRRRAKTVVFMGDSIDEGITVDTTTVNDSFADRFHRILGERLGGQLGKAWGIWRNVSAGGGHQEWSLGGVVTAQTIGSTGDVGFGGAAAPTAQSATSAYTISNVTETWTRPAGEHVKAFDVFVVDTGANSVAGSYSIDGGSTWVDYPLTTVYSSGTGILRRFRVRCDNPTTIKIRGNNAAGTAKAVVMPQLPLVTYETYPHFAYTDGLNMFNLGWGGMKLRQCLNARCVTDCTVTNGSPNIHSDNADFVSADDESTVYIDGVAYQIDSITDENDAVLKTNYAGTTGTKRLAIFQGDHTADRLATIIGHPGSFHPDLVVVGVYTNDAVNSSTALGDTNADFYKDMYTYLTLKLLAQGCDVLLLAAHEREPGGAGSNTAAKQQEYRDKIHEVGDEQGVAVMDIFDLMAQQGYDTYALQNAQGWIADTVHLSAEGNRFFAGRLNAMLEFG